MSEDDDEDREKIPPEWIPPYQRDYNKVGTYDPPTADDIMEERIQSMGGGTLGWRGSKARLFVSTKLWNDYGRLGKMLCVVLYAIGTLAVLFMALEFVFGIPSQYLVVAVPVLIVFDVIYYISLIWFLKSRRKSSKSS